jgi:hypothetical protein
MRVGGGLILAEPGPDSVQQRDDPVRGYRGEGAGRPAVRNGGRGRGHHRPSTHSGRIDHSKTPFPKNKTYWDFEKLFPERWRLPKKIVTCLV